ncbi:MAG TPA: amino acid adenylation domain-containing protein [Glycomyces sp.]|nr:amino acid adenylation domain-containing protein [Glycomyces sp.]
MRSTVETEAADPRTFVDGDRGLRPGGELVRHVERFGGRDGRWHVARIARLRGDLEAERLHSALRRAWDGLRPGEGPLAPELQVTEVIGHPLDAVVERAGSDAAVPFHPGAPIRARLYRIDDDDHVLAVAAHAAEFGAARLEALIGEATAAYSGRPAGARAEPRSPGEDHADYWREALAEAPVAAAWPRERPPGWPAGRYETRSLDVDEATAARIGRLAADSGTAVETVFRTALRAVLARHTGQYDLPLAVATGDPAAASVPEELLVVPSRMTARTPFAAAVGAEHAALRAAAEHDPGGFPGIAEAVKPVWHTAGLPLAPVRFDYRPSDPDWPLPGGEELRLASACFPFDLTVAVTGVDGHYRIDLACDAGLFDPGAPTALLDRLAVLLADAVAAPDRPLGDLAALTEADRALLLAPVETERTASPTLAALVRRQVERSPEAVAVRFEDQTRTYAELRDASDRVASRLLQAGLTDETPVAVMTERGADLPAVLLGVAKAGCASVPLDPAHPADRLAYVLGDAGARALITDERVDLPLPEGAVALRTADLLAPDPGPRTAAPDPHPDGLAYLLYTSGSTGRPKGVALTHGGLANCLSATVDLMDCRPGQRLLAVTTVSFDIAVLELFCMLVAGGETVVATGEQARDGQALRRALDRWRPDVMQATPMTWNMLLYCGWEGDGDLVVSCGGDVVPPSLAARLRSMTKGFWHTYGPTETSLYTVCRAIEPGPLPSPLPIGTCIGGNWVRILDERSRPVPPGAVGELCVGGAGVARGYTGPSGRTADRFVPDPRAPGRLLYRTGDLARMLPDGGLELHGRNDRQVKIRGQRVEPGEIEAVVARHPDVDAAAVAIVGAGVDQRIVAYVRPADPATARSTVKEVADYARQRLPNYMVPDAVAAIDRLPARPNGKIDRRALEAIVPPRAGRPEDPDPLAAAVSRLWDEWVGAADELRFSGEDLRRAAGFCDAVAREFGVEFPPSALHPAQSRSGCADRVRRARAAAEAEPVPLDRLRHDGWRAPAVLFTAGGHGALVDSLEPDRAVFRVPRTALRDGGPELADRLAATAAALPCPSAPVLVADGASGGLALRVARRANAAAGTRVAVVLVAAEPDGPVDDTGGPVVCVLPTADGDLAERWRRLGRRFELVSVPGDPGSLLDGPEAARLAGIVSSLA